MLPYLQANKLACYSFMTPGLESKESLLFISIEVPDSHCFPCAGSQNPCSHRQYEEGQETLAHTVSYITCEEP